MLMAQELKLGDIKTVILKTQVGDQVLIPFFSSSFCILLSPSAPGVLICDSKCDFMGSMGSIINYS